METISKFQKTTISAIEMRTVAAFVPILEERRAEIEQIYRQTFVYNPVRRTRNELDVYYPMSPTLTKNEKTPVLVFVYGGGFNTGSREFPEPYSMGHRALGSFFAFRGFITVIPDYRLVPEVRFPAASEDVRDAVNWISKNLDLISISNIPAPDVDAIFVMGHSAGSIHTQVLTLYPLIRRTIQPSLKGIIWAGSPWFFDVEKETKGPVGYYFGAQTMKEREPRTLWHGLSDEEIKNVPDILLARAEREPAWLLAAWETMVVDVKKRREEAPQTIICDGHNHISPIWALSSGQGEEWGEEVARWMKARLDYGARDVITSVHKL